MKTRPTLLLYVLTLLTSGLFAFVWIALMMRDVDRITGYRTFSSRLAPFLPGVAVVYIVLLAPMLSVPLDSFPHRILIIPVAILAIVLEALLFGLIVILHNKIRRASDLAPNFWTSALMVLLTMLMFVSLIVLERRLNKLSGQGVAG